MLKSDDGRPSILKHLPTSFKILAEFAEKNRTPADQAGQHRNPTDGRGSDEPLLQSSKQ